MKIGILLTGVSYGYNVGHEKADRDWNLTKDNLKTNLIDCFKDTDDVSVYLTTYKHPTNQEVFDFYQPKKLLLLDYEGSRQRTTYAQGLRNVLDEDLDFIIIGRFDIIFKQKITDLNIDFNKFNFIFREIEPHWTKDKFVSDTFFAFPKKFLLFFMEKHCS